MVLKKLTRCAKTEVTFAKTEVTFVQAYCTVQGTR